MRRFLLPIVAALVLAPGTANAGERVVLGREKYVEAQTPEEYWPNGSHGHMYVHAGYDDRDVDVQWVGVIYDDDGHVVLDHHYELEASIERGDGEFGVMNLEDCAFRSHLLDRAKFWVYDKIAFPHGQASHDIVFEVYWTGVGEPSKSIFPDGAIRTVGTVRAATLGGSVTIDGVVVPGGDLTTGAGTMVREVSFQSW